MTKYVYLFKEGNASMRNLLGGKGANLAEMTNLGHARAAGLHRLHRGLHPLLRGRPTDHSARSWQQIYDALAKIEKICGKKFGDPENPLLVSVRSGARASMPGMMDTILNLGLNDEVVEGLSPAT